MVIPTINKNVLLVVLKRSPVFQIHTLKYLWNSMRPGICCKIRGGAGQTQQPGLKLMVVELGNGGCYTILFSILKIFKIKS